MNEVLISKESKGNCYSLALVRKQDLAAYQAAPESAWSPSHPIRQFLDEAKTPSAHQATPEVDTPKKESCPSS